MRSGHIRSIGHGNHAAGHIGMTARLPLFARRLAPVQITYLGYPNTTGLTAMDYRFTDAIADPPGEADALATEQLVRFAPTAWAYRPLAHAPLVPPLPSADLDIDITPVDSDVDSDVGTNDGAPAPPRQVRLTAYSRVGQELLA